MRVKTLRVLKTKQGKPVIMLGTMLKIAALQNYPLAIGRTKLNGDELM